MNIKDMLAMKILFREKTLSTWFVNPLIWSDTPPGLSQLIQLIQLIHLPPLLPLLPLFPLLHAALIHSHS